MEISTKGFLDGKEVKGSTMGTWIRKFDGNRLDEITIQAKLNHPNDCDELILFLEMHKQCLTKGLNRETSNS